VFHHFRSYIVAAAEQTFTAKTWHLKKYNFTPSNCFN